jgi:tRNA A-37 threonylcarbamoyl transferase component Bud32
MAAVYRARHRVLGSLHALKVLRPDLVANAGIRQRFLDEGRVQAQFQHPGIVRVTDLVSEPGVAGLVMDLLVGRTLDVELAQGALSTERAVAWMMQVLSALEHAHGRGVVHRDLKPSNLFVVDHENGRRTIRVLDFGIAKVAGKGRTLAQETMGTWAYMSPEQIKSSASVDARSDVFALGAVLFEMLTGRVAFQGTSDFDTMQQVAIGRSEALERFGPDLPPSLRAAITRALAVDPDARFPSCAAFAVALEPLARPEDLALLDDWQGSQQPAPVLLGGSAAATWDGGTAFGELEAPQVMGAIVRSPALIPEVVPATDPGRKTPVVRVDASLAALRERHDVVVRAAGAAQVLTGILNTFVLWMLMCYGLPWVFATIFTALGLPGLFTWLTWTSGVLGCGLLVLGPIEMLGGAAGLLGGGRSRRGVQRVAALQLVGIGMGGVPSFLVGLAITALLLAVPDPDRVRGGD